MMVLAAERMQRAAAGRVLRHVRGAMSTVAPAARAERLEGRLVLMAILRS